MRRVYDVGPVTPACNLACPKDHMLAFATSLPAVSPENISFLLCSPGPCPENMFAADVAELHLNDSFSMSSKINDSDAISLYGRGQKYCAAMSRKLIVRGLFLVIFAVILGLSAEPYVRLS